MSMNTKDTGIIDKLQEASEAYMELDSYTEADDNEFFVAIRQAQRIIMAREYLRQKRQARLDAILENRRAQT